MTVNLKNWAGNYTYQAARLHRPETVEQVQELVVNGSKLRALGTRHSFNDIADSPEDLISLEYFTDIVALDQKRRTVTVGAGVRYGDLCRELHAAGYAVHNMASLPHISVAGACATATHGSGVTHGNLATIVSALELVTGTGEVVVLSRDQHGEQFQGAVVGLGGLGVVTQLTLDLVPAFEVRQDVYENLSLAQVTDHFEEVVSSAYSVSLFTNWQNQTFNQVWLKSVVTDSAAAEPEPELFGAPRATRKLHPIPGISAENCTEQMGIPGPWHERLPHFRLEYTPSSGEELQTEYFVPRKHAVEAVHAISGLSQHIAPLLQISEIRTIAADMLWMSPAFKQNSVGIHFTWEKNWMGVSKVLPLIEEALAPFQARPHWGKLFTMSPGHLQALYPKLPEFQQLLQHYDPRGKFRNTFLDTYIFGNH
ncbi:MAG: FAD-binding protein [Chloroflexi bacterium]|nr:MAG: FAD-binding protein [Chloroflexota bacterium]